MSEKKVGKRLLTWVLVLVMTLSLLPLNVLADETAPSDVKIGHYDEGGSWAEGTLGQDLPDGVDSVSKTAVPVGDPKDNTYAVTLQVVLKETTTNVPSQAATVLVIDISNSMDDCLEEGPYHNLGIHTDCKSRLDVAKDAATSFVNTYAGTVENSGRYLAIALFNYNSHTHLEWTDVSTSSGKQTAINQIKAINYGSYYDGGTNLEQGLALANDLLTTVPSENISVKNKNVIALTDGAPTRAGTNSDTSKGSAAINAATADTANAVKMQANLYTVCFGAESEHTWEEYHWKDVEWEYGPTVGDFLRSSIASGSQYAFNANNRSELNRAFSNISEKITSGLSSGTVHDSLPTGVTCTSGDFEESWNLTGVDGVRGTDGVTTYYTYTRTYTVKIDPTVANAEQYGGYYPLNNRTTLTVKDSSGQDVQIDFPIPAGKVTFPKQEYSVTYRFTGLPENGTNLPPLPTDSTVYYSGDEVTIQNPSTTTYTFNHKIYTFEGWKLNGTPVSDKYNISDSSLEFVGNWSSEDKPSYTVTYNLSGGTSTSTQLVFTGLFSGDKTPTIKTPTRAGYTFTGWSPKVAETVTGNAIYTAQWTRNYTPRPYTPPTVVIPDDDALGLNTTDHFAYIVGYGNGEVRPQNNITRAEVATIFFRLLTDDVRDENLTKTNRYSDVAATSWYNTAVSTLSSMGIITGYPDGTFRPNAAITRAEFAAIAARFDNDGDKTAAKFSDIATHWAKDEISIAYNNGWITGYPDGTFGPQRDITRAETMTLVNRVLNRQPETEDDLLPNMTVWTDNANPKAWYYLAVQEATNSHYYKFKTNSKYEKWTELRETRDWTQLEK